MKLQKNSIKSINMNGLTMVELLVVLTIVGILASIAIPGLGSILATNDLNTAQENVIGMLRKARGLAVSRSTIATVTLDAASKTAVLALSDGSGVVETVILRASVGIGEDAAYIFNPAGTATADTIVLSALAYPGIAARNITVTATGQVNASR